MCKLPRLLWKSGILCNGDWDWDTQDNEPYSEGWKSLTVNTSISDVVNYPWKYRTDSETNGAPHAGKIGVYPSGGYIVDLIGARRRVDNMIEDLIQLKWIDHRTRALFVEFTLYNPNVNLFTQTTVAFEVPASGSFVSEIVVKTFRLFSYLGGYGVVVALCDVLTLLFILYFSTRMLKKLRKERRAFFTTFWNGVEFLNFALSITCVVMYTGRHLLTSRATNTVKKLRG
ncbi:hypothetical protein LOTGIDRAFT_110212 [Lottia gigantea]|uniref:Uncharacterized protein n=1 Tax=Lottia gigantea TaxID=225164 RepID=V4B190_LOTGI|nr:hypothetical protein LOTGIDRAFT_110212 [Lottia gigantea]ESP04058.1 hypothetical protein LOTGIDRAFT_110212 [Lottia gigantea]